MAKQARSHAQRVDYAPDFWVARGLSEDPTTREKFIALAIDEVSASGPYSFNATLICDYLGTTYPMVNHYFGNRDGLVAEAVAVAYRQYIRSLRAAAEAESESPQKRLEAWAWQQVRWTSEHPGISAVLDFPQASLEVTSILRDKSQREMTDLFEYNMAVLMHLVADVQRGAITPIDLQLGNLPREELMSNLALVNRASSIGLATMGAAVWLAGRHVPGEPSLSTQEWRHQTIQSHIDLLVKLASDPL